MAEARIVISFSVHVHGIPASGFASFTDEIPTLTCLSLAPIPVSLSRMKSFSPLSPSA